MNGGTNVKTLDFVCHAGAFDYAPHLTRDLLTPLFAVLCAVVCLVCGAVGVPQAQAQDVDEPTSIVCGNFVMRIPSDATYEAMQSDGVQNALMQWRFNSLWDIGVIADRGVLGRIETTDGTGVYVYTCRALMDVDDVRAANYEEDEIVLQERGDWFASQARQFGPASLASSLFCLGTLHYELVDQPIAMFCFSNSDIGVGFVSGFVPLPSGYVSVVTFAFSLDESEAALALIDGIVPSMEVGDGFTTIGVMQDSYASRGQTTQDNWESRLVKATAPLEAGVYRDGEYESKTSGWDTSNPAVSVIIADGRVTSVTPSKYLDGYGFDNGALEQMCDGIVAANGIEDVDIVAGATATSTLVLKATRECLAEAMMCPMDMANRGAGAVEAEVSEAACATCHDGDFERLNHAPSKEQATQGWIMDPHNMPATEAHAGLSITCNDCHVVGKASVMACAQCHNGTVEVPGGWRTPSVHIDVTQDHMTAVSLDTCVTCHDGTVTRELDMAGAAAPYSWRGQPFDFHDMSADLTNGHATLLGSFNCQTCHAEKSVAACTTCHADVFTEDNLPEGWTIEQSEDAAADEAAALAEEATEAAPAADDTKAEAGPWYNDGIYTAEGKGIGGKVPVTVEVEGGVITTVTVGDNSETQGIGTRAIEKLPSAIVVANGAEGVDAVSGATVTSKAIFSAVDEALEQAGTTYVAPASTEADKPAAETGALADGTYTASARCSGGIVPVTVTYEGGKAVCIEIENNSALEEDDFKAVLAAIIACRSQAARAAVEIDRTAVENAVAAAEFSVDAAIEATAPTAEAGSLTGAALTDGTYTAGGKGIGGKVPVTVAIENGRITAVEVGDNSETQGIGSKAIEQLPAKIVGANGTEGVDAVSGATVTSKAILTAVEDCLEQAKGSAEAAERSDEAAPAEDAKADTKAEETAPAAETAYADGEYTAEGKGIGGKVPVTVTVKDGKVSDVEVGDNSETHGIGSKAIEQLPEAIVEANGTEGVDAVSGATVTSKAIFSAVNSCLKQAAS